jgi:thymidylate kinase
VLRGYERLPEVAGNDLDILVERSRSEEFESILLHAARASGLRRFARIERSAGSPVSHRFYDPESGQQLAVDLFVDLNWRGVPFLDEREVLDGRVARGPIEIPRPAHEAAASLFSKVLHGSQVEQQKRERLRRLVRSDRTEFERVSGSAFGPILARELLLRVERLELDPDSGASNRLRRALFRRIALRHPLATGRALARDARRAIGRARRPTGVFVVLLGPDGSGKSTLARPLAGAIAERLGGVSGVSFHWKPLRIRPASDDGAVTAPHARSPRSRAASRLFRIAHAVEFALGSWFEIRPALIKGRPVVGERYWFDLGLDPLRYRLDTEVVAAIECPALVESPDITLCLVADAEVFQQRKQEVSIETTRKQVAALEAFAEEHTTATRIDAARPFEEVLDRCERLVLDCLAARDERRRGAGNGGRLG